MFLIPIYCKSYTQIKFPSVDWPPDERRVEVVAKGVAGSDNRVFLREVEDVFNADINAPFLEELGNLCIEDVVSLELVVAAVFFGIAGG